jgi:hypothetical protein
MNLSITYRQEWGPPKNVILVHWSVNNDEVVQHSPWSCTTRTGSRKLVPTRSCGHHLTKQLQTSTMSYWETDQATCLVSFSLLLASFTFLQIAEHPGRKNGNKASWHGGSVTTLQKLNLLGSTQEQLCKKWRVQLLFMYSNYSGRHFICSWHAMNWNCTSSLLQLTFNACHEQMKYLLK